jgi:hypothetical protein
MSSVSVTASNIGPSRPIPIDLRRHKQCVGLLVTIAPGSNLSYSVELTGDKLQSEGYNPSSGNWNSHDTMSDLSTSKNGVLVFPVTGVRLNVLTWDSGSVTLSVVQAED